MLRKHINDDTVWSVPVKDNDLIGPCECPQEGCQPTGDDWLYKRGFVVIEEYGGGSGNYLTSYPCKCCDANGFIREGRRPYEAYCFAGNVRDINTVYPSPYPMSRALYNDPRLIEHIRLFSKQSPEKKESGNCYIASAVYGSADAQEVKDLRQFRDDVLMPSNAGRVLVGLYYFLSPSLAKRLTPSSRASLVIRSALNFLVDFLKRKNKKEQT